ncbi:MAG TPA: hypothetical protein VFU23_00385 [Gemmatimonadales bacterium]|nr:hypothetical protein [Gemmatimonadales bacterium]
MQLPVARRLRRERRIPVGPWALLGFGAGIAAGFLLGEMLGGGGTARAGRLVRSLKRTPKSGRRSDRADTILAVLHAEPELSGIRFSLVPSGTGGFELRGWVPNRSTRVRATRLAQAAAGSLTILSRLLVRGEDDTHPELVLDDEPRSA